MTDATQNEASNSAAPVVLVLTSDLTIESPLAGAAERAGVTLHVTSSIDALLAKASSLKPQIVVLDLSHPGLDPADLVARLRSAGAEHTKLVGFAPHVHRQRLAAAAEAGCDLVVSRGQFHAQIDEILKVSP